MTMIITKVVDADLCMLGMNLMMGRDIEWMFLY